MMMMTTMMTYPKLLCIVKNHLEYNLMKDGISILIEINRRTCIGTENNILHSNNNNNKKVIKNYKLESTYQLHFSLILFAYLFLKHCRDSL